MSSSSINREILRLAIPAIVSNITTPLLGLVDTAITGHMGATAYLAAIAVGGSMFSLTYWVMNFLRMGTSGLTSQHLSTDLPPRILRFSLLVALTLGVVLIAVSPWLCRGLLAFMDADVATSEFAATYYRILIFGAPAVLGTFALTGWFLGMQDSRSPMWMALVTNVVNIIASLVLVYACGLKIEGVAIGTLIAQYVGFGMGLWFLKGRRFSVARNNILKNIQFPGDAKASPPLPHGMMRRFFTVNVDIFLRTLCLVAVTLWFTRAGARQGDDIVAANALLMQLFILFSYFMDGFAFAAEAMAGKYFGLGDRSMLRATIRGTFVWGAAVVVLFTTVYVVCGRPILEILTDDPTIVDTAMRYLPWAIAVPLAGVAAFVWDGIFVGMTLTRGMLVSMAIATATFFVVYASCHGRLGNHGLWLAFIAYLALRGLLQTIIYTVKARRDTK